MGEVTVTAVITPLAPAGEPTTVPPVNPVVPAAVKLFVADNKALPLNVVLVEMELISLLS